jgi:hypothetical protein
MPPDSIGFKGSSEEPGSTSGEVRSQERELEAQKRRGSITYGTLISEGR